MNSVVKWDLTPEDISLASADVAYASTIYVLWFGWLFSVAELEYCINRWEEPCWLSGVVNDQLLAEACSSERSMDYVSHHRVIHGQEIQYVSQLVEMPGGNMRGRRYIEKVVLAQLEVLVQPPTGRSSIGSLGNWAQAMSLCLEDGFVLGSSGS
jgi:hypothetical protein